MLSLKRIRVSEPCIGDEEVEAVIRVLRSKWLAHGPLVEEFEKLFASYVGSKHAIAVVNGTQALKLILQSIGIGPGDEVIVPCFTFIATANVVIGLGAKPVFVDIYEDTYTINVERVVEAITPRTRAIIAVHLFGHPADMRALREIAEDYKLVLVEDAAQAHGASTPEGMVGSLGDAAAFSFYATKNMTTGEGGMITTNSDAIAFRIRMLRNHGQTEKYLHVCYGENYRMTSIQAAIGIVQLRKLDKMNEARRRNAHYLTSRLKPLGFITPIEKPGYKHVYHQYVVRVVESKVGITRDTLRRELEKRGIETAIHYPSPIPDQPFYRALGYPPSRLLCPTALKVSKEVMSLPVHPCLSREDLEFMVNAIREVIEGY